jgi:hypothetical protein
MAIGSCFYQEADSASLRVATKQWVHRAQAWVSGPLDKKRLNLSGLQIQCLLLLARHANDVDSDFDLGRNWHSNTLSVPTRPPPRPWILPQNVYPA